MWTFTKDGWRDAGGRKIHSLYNTDDALLSDFFLINEALMHCRHLELKDKSYMHMLQFKS